MIKVSKGDLEKARKECDITKTKSADLTKFKGWIFGASGKVGAKIFAQMLSTIDFDLQFEVAQEAEYLARLAAVEASEKPEEDEGLDMASWECDVTQFHAWVNSGTEVSLLVNAHAAELAWPEPEPDDLNPELQEAVIKELWAELDWDDDKKISIESLKALRMLIAMSPTTLDLKNAEMELDLDEFGLFNYEAFRDWINTDSPTAEKTRRHAAAGKRGSDAAERAAKAAVALTSASVGGIYGGLAVGVAGTVAGVKGVKKVVGVIGNPTGKVLFTTTKTTLSITAKVGGAGGVVMDRLEKSMLDPDLTEDQVRFMLFYAVLCCFLLFSTVFYCFLLFPTVLWCILR